MQKLDFSLQFEETKKKSSGYPVVIVAAGSSSRMQGVDKQFSPLCGIPVLARTLKAFENSPFITEITVVTREEKIADIEKLGKRYAISKLKNVIVGGASREESVKNGISLYKEKSQKILVHDGARPLVTQEVIQGVANALETSDSVACGVKIKDTVKIVDDNGMVTHTPDRSKLVSVQTPQGVDINKFLMICKNKDLSLFTDDTSVMEAGGITTQITQGDYSNIKITTPEDIALAQGIIEKEW
jgi:2-C-methyl-D-erythritol 4-phosphate cytidylyltransferase